MTTLKEKVIQSIYKVECPAYSESDVRDAVQTLKVRILQTSKMGSYKQAKLCADQIDIVFGKWDS